MVAHMSYVSLIVSVQCLHTQKSAIVIDGYHSYMISLVMAVTCSSIMFSVLGYQENLKMYIQFKHFG